MSILKKTQIKFKINAIPLTLNLIDNINSKFTILEISLQNGVYIPHFCFNRYLQIAGNCRICIVEVTKLIKPIISCLNLVIENLELFTHSFSLKKMRENVLEFLLVNHPLDCPICDQAGECDLQEQTLRFGLDRSRYYFSKKSNLNFNLNNYIKLILNRCILCTRCIRFTKDNNLDFNISFLLGSIGRGSLSKVHLYKNTSLNLSNSANIIDICPVGALTLKLNQFSFRPWEFSSILTFDFLDIFSSPIKIDFKNFKVIRVLPELDPIFYLNIINDSVRFKIKFDSFLKKKDFELSSFMYNSGLIHKNSLIILNIINNCFLNFKLINVKFKNFLNTFKLIKSNINYYSVNLNEYLFNDLLLRNLKTFYSVIINKNNKFYMYRFFAYLNEINKNLNNILYLNTNDFSFFNLFSLYKLKKNISFNSLKLNTFNITFNVYIIKFLSFFKILLSLDDLIFYNLLNINYNIHSSFFTFFDFYTFSFSNIILQTKIIYNLSHKYTNNLIYNILGVNTQNYNKLILNNIIYVIVFFYYFFNLKINIKYYMK